MDFIYSLIASISSITFGIVATLTEYKYKSGKIKPVSVWLIGGIACGGALALIANELTSVSSTATSALRHEEMLRSIWRSENAVETSSMKVKMQFTYATGCCADEPPMIFMDKWKCLLRAGKDIPLPPPGKVLWGAGGMMANPQIEIESNFAQQQRTVKSTIDSREYVQVNYITEFSVTEEFETEWRQKWGITSDWNGASLELVFEGVAGKDESAWWSIVDQGDFGTKDNDFWQQKFTDMYDTSKVGSMDFSFQALPVDIETVIYIGDHALPKVRALAVLVRMYDEDVSGRIIILFPVVNLPQNYFEKFADNSNDETSVFSNTILLIMGGILSLGIFLALGVTFKNYRTLVRG